MSMTAVDMVSWACLVVGGAFSLIGAFGLVRLPDVFSRMHAGGVSETLGVLLLFLGMAIQAFEIMPTTKAALIVAGKLVLIAAFLFFTNPTTTHALAQAALWGGIDPKTGRKKDGGEGT
ncbi:MAG TPA: sodium:proton antiporter [Rhodospirillaceae bacterium]|nr:sodium:proton antiporter [Rhodospirillaceae bacterium]HAA91832.1 sodium:proton antiporter [Rhodospirillaceae bacterium]HAT34103.1 sodium:proton antiporter [Rhodospirillaceae bacterium]|tara:strand:- start:138 stop:494 length:357 start_codon:yes stop_codon:yes gene_type:complete